VKKIVSIMLVIVLALSFTVSVFAESDTQSKMKADKGKEIQIAVNILEKYVNRLEDGTFELRLPRNEKLNVSNDVLNQITQGMNTINKLIKEGTLTSTENLTVYDPKDTSFSLQDGVNKIEFKWYGFDIYLNHAVCWNITHALNVAAAAAAITAAIPAASTVAAIIAGALWLDATIIDWNDAGSGVVIFFLANGQAFWIGGQ